MALTNRDRLGKGLDQLRDGLLPYISRQLYDNLGSNWQDRLDPKASNLADVAVLINLFIDHWPTVFKKPLSQSDRAYVSELKEARNKWAHSEPLSSDDVDRDLDIAARLCRNISASEQADAIRALREELQQQVFTDRAGNRTRYQATVENQVMAGLVPWREVITPHPDVINGRYQQAEFAADLDLVHRGIGSPEYTDPIEIFRRTFMTEGPMDLLIMPSSMLIDDNDGRNELVRFLDNQWEPIIATDVDGAQSDTTQPRQTVVTTKAPGKPTTWPSTGDGSRKPGDAVAPPPPTPPLPPKPQLPTRYVASVRLDPTRASLQISAFVEEVMSHLQALPGAQIEMTLEVQVNAPAASTSQQLALCWRTRRR